MKRIIIGLLAAILLAGSISPAVQHAYGQADEPPMPETFESGAPADQAQAAPAVGDIQLADFDNTIYLPLTTRPSQNSTPPGSFNPGKGWPTVGANEARTSWTTDTAGANLNVAWYRPIEAYISQNTQLIASDGLILVSTSRGLYALNPVSGATVWRYDTQMPLGNSPTVANGVAYVGGYDRKLHALNVQNGQHLWEFAGAGAGYDTNPLVVDGRVFAGNRDGYMYAIGANATPQQGQQLWRFKTDGPIHLSAAYKNGVVYFASDDNFAYALRASDGGLVWKSKELPGDGYHSYWPVVYQDKVIFSASHGYRAGSDPGVLSVEDSTGASFPNYNRMQLLGLFPTEPENTLVGPTLPSQAWGGSYPIMDASRILEYYEAKPDNDPNKHKPWRRTTIILNAGDGNEYTFDTDGDGYPEYAPVTWWGTSSGNRYPPIVGPNNILYFNTLYQNRRDSIGRVMGWQIGTKYLSVTNIQGALAEPQALSGGGNMVFRSICCDRGGASGDITGAQNRNVDIWSYDLDQQAPGYDSMWTILPGLPRLHGWYKGNSNSINGIYHNHGDQNPLIPYGGMVFTHRSNAIIAFGTGASRGAQPLLTIAPNAPNTSNPIGADQLRARLETEVTKIIQAGHLRPGYMNNGTFAYPELEDYFENPGDTLLALSTAYPYVSASLQGQIRTYLQQEWTNYFDPGMYTSIGWAQGAAREWMPLPPEIQAKLSSFPKSQAIGRWSWSYPQHNFYAMWKYAVIDPSKTARAYELAKSELQVPVPGSADAAYFRERPFELNAYIAGYIGFMRLQELAGRSSADSTLRTQVANELNRLYALRVSIFSKDTPYLEDGYHKRSMNIARNFIYLTPELGGYLRQNDLSRWQAAIQEYEYVAPYWFVSRYEAMVNESTIANLYNAPALFQARAYILNQPQSELVKYLDAPAFERGDLFYMMNLVAALQAP